MNLLEKYNVPVPRYTSFPTVPHWKPDSLNISLWKSMVAQASCVAQSMSLYIHIPYCESLCTYCGYNKRITLNHAVEEPYVHSVLKEWSIYQDTMLHSPSIEEIHLGGGTPTFLSAYHL